MTPADYSLAPRSERLRAVADELQAQLYAIATLEQANIKLFGGEWGADRAGRFRAIAGAESLISHLLAIGLDAKTRGHQLPTWLPVLLDQLDAAYLADLPGPVMVRADD
jgi:hypothetical protein